MSILDDTHCQFCEKLKTKVKWDNHLYSDRRLRTEVNGY